MASLDEIRKEAHRRYADYPLELSDGTTVVLRAPLRLSSEERTSLRGMQTDINRMQEDENYADGDLLEVLRNIILTVAHDIDKGQALVNELGDDLSVLQTLFENYTESTQPGEASNSVN